VKPEESKSVPSAVEVDPDKTVSVVTPFLVDDEIPTLTGLAVEATKEEPVSNVSPFPNEAFWVSVKSKLIVELVRSIEMVPLRGTFWVSANAGVPPGQAVPAVQNAEGVLPLAARSELELRL
jgi:hypothetical protein